MVRVELTGRTGVSARVTRVRHATEGICCWTFHANCCPDPFLELDLSLFSRVQLRFHLVSFFLERKGAVRRLSVVYINRMDLFGMKIMVISLKDEGG